jgi:hypothetical protein
MSSQAKDKFWDDIEIVMDGFTKELTDILKYTSYETPEVQILENLESEFKYTLETIKKLKNKYKL